MNNAGNTIPRKPLSFHINQTERALSALLLPIRRQILAALQQREGQSAAQLAVYCDSNREDIIVHIRELVRHHYIYVERIPNGTYYYMSNKRLSQVNTAINRFFTA